MSTPSDRLRRARKDAGFRTATDFAEALGISKNTYLQHENGTRAFDAAAASQYARKARTTPEHLLYDRKPVARDDMREIVGYAGADPEGTVLFAHGQGTGDYAPVPPNGSPTAQCVEIRGHSMPFFADDGALVWFDDQKTKPDREMIGHVVVVQLDTDEVLIKRLLNGSDKGLYDLESIAGPTRHDVRPVWVARIISIIPALEARRIIQRGGLAA
jgi:transcriptional regulator with XRE-family HTH domain